MRITKMIVLFFIFGSAVCFAGEKSFEQQLKEHEAFAKNFGDSKLGGEGIYQQHLLPQEKDREFIRKNKEKYEFLNEEEILNISKENFDSKVSKGKIEGPNAINHRDLNQASTAKSLRRDDASKDKSKTTPNEYLDIAIKTEESKRKYKKDLEEKQIKDAINIIEDPAKTLKEFGMDPGCKEEEDDIQESLNPKIKNYKVKEKSKETTEEHKTCEESEPVAFMCDRRLKLTCDRKKECDNGGIIAKSVQSDMQWTYNFPILTVGTIADNYWTGTCAIYDRTTNFQVKNISKITEFKIFEVGFDDYLWIKINGNTVYVGPDAGDRVEMIDKVSEERSIFGVRRNTRRGVTTNGDNLLGCERNTSWKRSVTIDLKSYLKEGENNIWMRVLVSGAGEGWMKISAKQHCCDSWKETWEDVCEQDLKKMQ